MRPCDVLYNAFLACGMEPKRKLTVENEYVIVDGFIYVFSLSTGKYIKKGVDNQTVDIIEI
jgi:hypothetical protein